MNHSHPNPITDLTQYRRSFGDIPEPMSPAATLFIVSGDSGMRQALCRMSESMGIPYTAYATAEAFLAGFDPTLPGCLLLDIHAPQMGGLRLQQYLQHQDSWLPLLFVSRGATVPEAAQAIQGGAVDFIIRPLECIELLKARIEACLAQVRQNQITQHKEAEITARLARLTRREWEIMEGMIAGKLSKQMALEWNVSIKTVESHRARVMKKLQVGNYTELINLVLSQQEKTREVTPIRGRVPLE
ncbi:response regulator transcription factor [Nitrosococcus wardiae]|uniref:Response regulator transcription factor n=1 Tax=Nitrosococcus wardiae TaxID=1814290 RepID=A0A4P7C292_9GAMM|nr:LuxR C-terminal-related transcriptional regulator [Nitrosococcus wardiae]QBQ55770.1 response regulator transcription factor [Nitrosococcus wardiae]